MDFEPYSPTARSSPRGARPSALGLRALFRHLPCCLVGRRRSNSGDDDPPSQPPATCSVRGRFRSCVCRALPTRPRARARARALARPPGRARAMKQDDSVEFWPDDLFRMLRIEMGLAWARTLYNYISLRPEAR